MLISMILILQTAVSKSASQLSFGARVEEALLLMVVGMGGVFASLFFMAVMIWVFKVSDEKMNASRIKRYSEKIEAKEVDSDLNDEIVAAITAAVAVTFKKHIVIRQISLFNRSVSNSWSSSGRQTLLGSHIIQRKR